MIERINHFVSSLTQNENQMKNKLSIFAFIILSIACIGMNAQPISELSEEQLQGKVDKFQNMRTTGIVLTAIGIPAFIGGVILYVNGLDESNTSSGDISDIEGKAWAGLGLMVIGELALGGGIVLWAMGGSKVKKYRNELNMRQQSLSMQSGKHGIGLVYRF